MADEAKPEEKEERDLTAVLVPAGQLTVEKVLRHRARERAARRAGARGAAADAEPGADRGARSAARHADGGSGAGRRASPQGGRATFVHVNHSAKQAMVHGFVDGKANEGFAGAPGDDFAARLRDEAGARSGGAARRRRRHAPRHRRGLVAHGRALSRGARSRSRRARRPGSTRSSSTIAATPSTSGEERLALFAFDRKRDVRRRGAHLGRAAHRARRPGAFGPLEAHARGGRSPSCRRRSASAASADAQAVGARARAVRVRRGAGVGRRRRARLLGRARAAAVRHLRRRDAAGAGARRRRGRGARRRDRVAARGHGARRCRSPRRPTAKGRC